MKSPREIARRSESGVEIRSEPLRVTWRLADLAARDNHLLNVQFTCSVRAIDNPTERAVFVETFLVEGDLATIDDVARHFTPTIRAACAESARALDADGSNEAMLLEAAKSAANSVAFACGIELLAPFEIHIESPTLQQQKIESMQRQLAERRAAGQVEHFQRAREMLQQFQSLKDADPALSPGKILEQIAPADRGAMLQTLLLAAAGENRAELFAVSGDVLVRVDPRAVPPTFQSISLPQTLGPLRSVRAADDRILIGARAGVIVTTLSGGDPVIYQISQLDSQLGFNSVAFSNDTIWASHSEVGIVAWSDADETPRRFECRDAKNLVMLDDSQMIFSAGSAVKTIDRAGEITTLDINDTGINGTQTNDTEVVEIVPAPRSLFIARVDGTVQELDQATLQLRNESRPCNSIAAAAALPWFGSMRLVLASVDGNILCVGTDDSLVTQFNSPHRGFKSVATASDCVAALSGDRQRIVMWHSWNGAKPTSEIHLAGATRHRIGDICFSGGSSSS